MTSETRQVQGASEFEFLRLRGAASRAAPKHCSPEFQALVPTPGSHSADHHPSSTEYMNSDQPAALVSQNPIQNMVLHLLDGQ